MTTVLSSNRVNGCNHNKAIDPIIERSDYLYPLPISGSENIHHILTKDLGVEKNIRKEGLVSQEQITHP